MRIALAAVALVVTIALEPLGRAQADPTPVNFTLAFIGDQGLGPDPRAVLTLIRNEGASAVLHSGDFEYTDTPRAFEDQVNAVLGQNFPYFASVGNHDADTFYGPGGYQAFLAARMTRLGIAWKGDLGAQASFTYRGIFFVLTAPGVFSDDDGDRVYAPFLANELAADHSLWRISSWHKDMELMQVGGKSDETGWGVYEAARRGGAITATGHEHSYSRTHLLSSCQTQTVASTANTLVLARDDPGTPADEGRSFVFVSGLGGRSIRDQQLSGPWWASIYTATQGANYGALFGVFNYQGDPGLAHFYFKDIGGHVADDFFVRAASSTRPPCLLDVDGNGRVEVATDVVYIARRLVGLTPVPPSFRLRDPTIPADSVIAGRIDAAGAAFDVDMRGGAQVATDVTYIARRLLALTVVPPSFRTIDPTIPSDGVIRAKIDALCP